MRKIGNQAGFTIIEVMLVVMIIGVLAAIVLPSIRVETARVKMSEALLATGPCKSRISEIYLSGGDDLPFAHEWGCEITSNVSTYVDAVDTDDVGAVLVTLHGFNDGRIDVHVITLVPLDNAGNIPSTPGTQIARWRCGSPADGTDVPPKYLPSSCRG
jgi:type IV pilus assembly protein PilA